MVEVSRSKWHNADKIANLRLMLPQVIATIIGNVHLIDLGLAMAMPSIIIPALMGISNQSNRNEHLLIDGDEASWISSIGCIVQVIGSLMAGFLCDLLGRRKLLQLANIPFIIGWLFLYQANTVWDVYIGLVFLGMSNGMVENTVYTYLGEICSPSVRGMIFAICNMCCSIGIFIAYNLNAWLSWRSIALVCLSAPVLSAILLFFVPETPPFLLSKKQTKNAEKSLRWLRGWTTKQAIAHEFYELQRHSERSKSCNECMKQDLQCSHPPPTFGEKCAELKRKRTLKPFTIIISLFFIAQFVGVWSMRPFAMQIFRAYESPISTDDTMIFLGFLDNLSYIVFMCLLRFTGRRRGIYLTMISGVFLSTLVISCYGYIYLPKGITSFGQQNKSFHLENPNLGYVPLICLYVWNFCTLCALSGMPMMLISELFSFKTRALASGISTSVNYVMGFISKKTYYNLEMLLSLPGTSLFYSVISGAGLIFAYFIFPETEGRSLEDIELHFSDNSKGLTDRKIAKSPKDPTENQSNQFLSEKF